MNTRINSTTSLVTLALLISTVVGDANAGSVRNERHTSKQIQACVSEIARHADYDNAYRVVHSVDAIKQRNLIETEIRIETSVYLRNGDRVAREYSVFCVIGTMGDLVKLRVEKVGTSPG